VTDNEELIRQIPHQGHISYYSGSTRNSNMEHLKKGEGSWSFKKTSKRKEKALKVLRALKEDLQERTPSDVRSSGGKESRPEKKGGVRKMTI